MKCYVRLISEFQPLSEDQLALVDVEVQANKQRLKKLGYNERKRLDKQNTAKGPLMLPKPVMLAIMDARQGEPAIPVDPSVCLEEPSSSSDINIPRGEQQACLHLLGHIKKDCKAATKKKHGSTQTQNPLSKYFPKAAPRE